MNWYYNIKNKVETYTPSWLKKLGYPFLFIIVFLILLFGFWKFSDWISDWKVDRKIAEYEQMQKVLSDKNKKLEEDNTKLSGEKKNLEDQKLQSDKLILDLMTEYSKKKSEIIYVDRKIAGAKSDYEKALELINRQLPVTERLARLCESRKSIGYVGGICK